MFWDNCVYVTVSFFSFLFLFKEKNFKSFICLISDCWVNWIFNTHHELELTVEPGKEQQRHYVTTFATIDTSSLKRSTFKYVQFTNTYSEPGLQNSLWWRLSLFTGQTFSKVPFNVISQLLTSPSLCQSGRLPVVKLFQKTVPSNTQPCIWASCDVTKGHHSHPLLVTPLFLFPFKIRSHKTYN